MKHLHWLIRAILTPPALLLGWSVGLPIYANIRNNGYRIRWFSVKKLY